MSTSSDVTGTAANADFDTLIQEAEKLCERRNPNAEQLIAQARSLLIAGDTRQAAMMEYITAFCDCFINNNYEGAVQRLNASLAGMTADLYNAVGYKLLMTLGNAHQLKGDLFSAQESYLQGLKTLNFKRNDLSVTEKSFFAAFYYNLATLLNNSELAMDATDYLEEAIKIYAEIGSNFKLAQCYIAYAQMMESHKDYQQAIVYLHKAIELGTRSGDAYVVALATANLGAVSVNLEKTEDALQYFNNALQYYKGQQMHYETAMLKFEMAKAYVHLNDLDNALLVLAEAETLLLNMDNRKELAEIYRLKATVLTLQQKHAEANIYLEKYIDSLKYFFDSEKTNALARAKKEFESDRKEKEARLLREKNEEIKRYANKLEISNNELKQFASVASHDLKEPLRMIASYIFLLRKSLATTATTEQEEFCNYAMDGAKRMERMVHNLLRLARVDADVRIEPVNLNAVVEEVKLNLRTLIQEKHAAINSARLPTITADKTQMVQLFQNLISNGINYNISGAPVIDISSAVSDAGIEIEITDNGVGIPEHFKDSAFMVFRTLTNNAAVKGTGIGLAICKKVVEKMHGKITIADAPSGGTTFKVTLGREVLA